MKFCAADHRTDAVATDETLRNTTNRTG